MTEVSPIHRPGARQASTHSAAVMRTNAQNASTRSFLVQKASVVYAVSPTELKVNSWCTVINQEPMTEHREVPRQQD
jgi:hypothetical protein